MYICILLQHTCIPYSAYTFVFHGSRIAVYDINFTFVYCCNTLSPETGEVALIFTFYSDEEGGDQIEDINIEEIEQEVEDDVMRAAMTLGLNITVLEFVRFGT